MYILEYNIYIRIRLVVVACKLFILSYANLLLSDC
jgi:hypothetical protein